MTSQYRLLWYHRYLQVLFHLANHHFNHYGYGEILQKKKKQQNKYVTFIFVTKTTNMIQTWPLYGNVVIILCVMAILTNGRSQ